MSTAKRPQDNRQRKVHLLTEKSPFSVQEAYRALRTNVMFALPGSACKIIGITSPTPGDGKSTTAANLSIALAQIGKRVILVDCDLRLPTVASKFRLPLVPGMTDFLVGQAKIDEAVRRVDSHGISILPAGSLPADPTGLLEAKQLENLFNALRKIYDFVIVDLPPVQTVPDAMILSKHIDGYLLMVREKQSRHREVSETLKQMRIADVKLLGFVSTGGKGRSHYYYKKR